MSQGGADPAMVALVERTLIGSPVARQFGIKVRAAAKGRGLVTVLSTV